jgi:cobyrinic acid a,c-diamide synthase
MAALRRKGIVVQGFKTGPDYIDTGLHMHASGITSHNLDSWMGSESVVKTVFCKNAARAQISVIEGVMGLYDGFEGGKIRGGSSAEIALMLDVPVILVVDGGGLAQSCVALVKGYMDYEPRVNIKGVVFNNTGSIYHKNLLTQCVEEELGVKVLGCLTAEKNIKMPERHLGLLPAEENEKLQSSIALMADLAEREIDLAQLLEIANQAGEIEFDWYCGPPRHPGITIGIAKDKAFSFYYQDSLDYLMEQGARLEYFSPLRDQSIPRVDGLYLGGGFPEVFLDELSANQAMMDSIREAVNKGIPVFAECGGFMYLARSISDFGGKTWSGVGIIPARVKMTNKLAALGYVEARALRDSILARKGEILKGHEFHYSQISGIDESEEAYLLAGRTGKDFRNDGYARGNILASYVHVHLRSNPLAVHHFLDACQNYRRKTMN